VGKLNDEEGMLLGGAKATAHCGRVVARSRKEAVFMADGYYYYLVSSY